MSDYVFSVLYLVICVFTYSLTYLCIGTESFHKALFTQFLAVSEE